MVRTGLVLVPRIVSSVFAWALAGTPSVTLASRAFYTIRGQHRALSSVHGTPRGVRERRLGLHAPADRLVALLRGWLVKRLFVLYTKHTGRQSNCPCKDKNKLTFCVFGFGKCGRLASTARVASSSTALLLSLVSPRAALARLASIRSSSRWHSRRNTARSSACLAKSDSRTARLSVLKTRRQSNYPYRMSPK